MKKSLIVVLVGISLAFAANAGFMNGQGHGDGVWNGRGGPDIQERGNGNGNNGNHYGWNHDDFSGNGHRGGPMDLPGNDGMRGNGRPGGCGGQPGTNQVPDAGAMLAFIVLAAGGLSLLRRR